MRQVAERWLADELCDDRALRLGPRPCNQKDLERSRALAADARRDRWYRRIMQRSRVMLVFLIALASTGCKQRSHDGNDDRPHTPAPPPPFKIDDLRAACDGKPEPRAADYDDTKPKAHRLVTFASYAASGELSLSRGGDFAAFATEDAKEVELVGCVRRVAVKRERSCTIQGKKLDLASATYELSIHVAKTGKAITQKTNAYDAPSCPSMFFFDGKDDTEYPNSDHAMRLLTAPIVFPDGATDAPAAEGSLSKSDLDKVCDGIPEGRAAGYAGKKGDVVPTKFARWRIGEDIYFSVIDDAVKPFDGEPSETQLVACLKEREGTRVIGKSCDYSSSKLELAGATWDVEVREAKTAKTIGAKTFTSKPDLECPLLYMFQGSAKAVDVHLPPMNDVVAFVKSPTIAKKP
jgi:hypothetical protein